MNKSRRQLNFQIATLESSHDKVVGGILRSEPDYFTWEPTIEKYCAEAKLPGSKTLVARNWTGKELGCIVGRIINENTVELVVVAVRRESRNIGIGSALIEAILHWTAAEGRKLVMHRTVGLKGSCPADTMVYEFFKKQGFVALDEYDFLWADMSCAVMVQAV
ncbi:MAG: GNAT family N-acetyltransferase [Candidatus Obscuribacter sp.]|nr:GNAT family N-acetyltransferase [Candidatus Obscuribacter sp.]MBK9278671.1 GNAT family N-acetyltransferase [Candidatus Obscuribacter sp.]